MEARQNTLTITGLRTEFLTPEGPLAAVDGVDLAIPRGSIVGLVGESGCGKSVTALSVLGLVPPAGRVAAGEIRFGETDLRTLGEGALRKLRGNRIAMIFQDPMTSLNPVYPVGRQVAEVLRLHRRLDRWAAKARTVELFQQVGIPDPAARYDAYPRQLSGGLRQRVMIAMAMACEPELLIADEPTTALDVTIQAQILRLMGDLRRDHGTAILLITHNMGVVAQLCGTDCGGGGDLCPLPGPPPSLYPGPAEGHPLPGGDGGPAVYHPGVRPGPPLSPAWLPVLPPV